MRTFVSEGASGHQGAKRAVAWRKYPGDECSTGIGGFLLLPKDLRA